MHAVTLHRYKYQPHQFSISLYPTTIMRKLKRLELTADRSDQNVGLATHAAVWRSAAPSHHVTQSQSIGTCTEIDHYYNIE